MIYERVTGRPASPAQGWKEVEVEVEATIELVEVFLPCGRRWSMLKVLIVVMVVLVDI